MSLSAEEIPNMDGFSLLPSDILALIINYLDITAVGRLALCNNKYRYLSRHLLRTISSRTKITITLDRLRTWFTSVTKAELPKKLSFNNIRIHASIDDIITCIPSFYNANFVGIIQDDIRSGDPNHELWRSNLKANHIIISCRKYLDNYSNGDIDISIKSNHSKAVHHLIISCINGEFIMYHARDSDKVDHQDLYDLVMRVKSIDYSFYNYLVKDKSYDTLELLSKVKRAHIHTLNDLNTIASRYDIVLKLDMVRIVIFDHLLKIKEGLWDRCKDIRTGEFTEHARWNNIQFNSISINMHTSSEHVAITALEGASIFITVMLVYLPNMKFYLKGFEKPLLYPEVRKWISEHNLNNNMILTTDDSMFSE